MWFGRRKAEEKRVDDKVNAIHAETFNKIDRVTESIDRATDNLEKLNQLLEDGKLGATGNIFLATPAGSKYRQERNSRGNK